MNSRPAPVCEGFHTRGQLVRARLAFSLNWKQEPCCSPPGPATSYVHNGHISTWVVFRTLVLIFAKQAFTCLCKSLLLLQFWAYPRFFKVLQNYLVIIVAREQQFSQPSLLFELDHLLPRHPVQPLVQLPHAQVDKLLGGRKAVTGLLNGYLLVADDRRLLAQDGIVCAWICHLAMDFTNMVDY